MILNICYDTFIISSKLLFGVRGPFLSKFNLLNYDYIISKSNTGNKVHDAQDNVKKYFKYIEYIKNTSSLQKNSSYNFIIVNDGELSDRILEYALVLNLPYKAYLTFFDHYKQFESYFYDMGFNRDDTDYKVSQRTYEDLLSKFKDHKFILPKKYLKLLPAEYFASYVLSGLDANGRIDPIMDENFTIGYKKYMGFFIYYMMERIKNERLRIYNNPREEDKEESLFLDRLDKLQVDSKMSLKEFLSHNLHNKSLHLYDTLVDYNIIEKIYDKSLDISSYIRFMGEYGDIHFSTGYEGFNKFKFNSLLKNFFIDQYMDKNIIEPIL